MTADLRPFLAMKRLKKAKGDDVKASSCCGAPIELHPTGYWRCSECRREIKA